ncbi:MAG: hypothetical protein HFE68_03295 [Erysipelotrichaceae bacterium]|nr:hypothetical protein [Erysipelotrichaceae bacterium]
MSDLVKIEYFDLDEIQFEHKAYDPALAASLKRMGLGFAIKLRKDEHGVLHCVDGAKRLSAISDLIQQEEYRHLRRIAGILLNQARSASTQAKNHH